AADLLGETLPALLGATVVRHLLVLREHRRNAAVILTQHDDRVGTRRGTPPRDRSRSRCTPGSHLFGLHAHVVPAFRSIALSVRSFVELVLASRLGCDCARRLA